MCHVTILYYLFCVCIPVQNVMLVYSLIDFRFAPGASHLTTQKTQLRKMSKEQHRFDQDTNNSSKDFP